MLDVIEGQTTLRVGVTIERGGKKCEVHKGGNQNNLELGPNAEIKISKND